MSTRIEWTRGDDGTPGVTWNPVTGCTKVSRGCDNCYITRTPPFRMAGRRFDQPGIGGTTGIQLHPKRLGQPSRWRKPRRVFVNSMSDLFHDDVPDGFIGDLWNEMAFTPWHTYQILTKRPARMRSLLSKWAADDWHWRTSSMAWAGPVAGPLPNVWLGVSTEDQATADLRIPILLDTPAAVRFISAEPLLGPIDLHGPLVDGHRPRLTYWLDGRPGWGPETTTPTGPRLSDPVIGPRLDWVICGGESGPGARPMHPDWARTLRDQCVQADVPFFFKQWGHFSPIGPVHDDSGCELFDESDLASTGSGCAVNPDGARPVEWTSRGLVTASRPKSGAWWMARVGKTPAGRVLDGRTWDQYPTVETHAAATTSRAEVIR